MSRSFSAQRRLAGRGRRRLQTLYLVAATGLAAIIPLIFFAGVWVRSELGKAQIDTERFLSANAKALSQQVDAEIEHQLVALRAFSVLPQLDEGQVDVDELAQRAVASMAHWSSLSLLAIQNGRLDTSNPALPPSVDAATVERAVSNGKPLIETRPVPKGARGGIDIYMPVMRNGAPRAVLLLSLDADDIQDLVMRQGWTDRLAGLVVDRDGRILAHSGGADTLVGTTVGPVFRDGTANRDAGLFDGTTRDGDNVSVAFARSPVTGWISAAQISRHVNEGVLTRSRLATIAAGVLSLLVAGILAVFITHTLSERRTAEERLSASRALGDLDARLLATSQEALADQRKASSEREVLLREIYHRVKNNLQIVQSLLRLGSRELKPDQREPFESAVRRIGAMSRVHTLLYNSPDLASIDFKDYLEELLRELSEGFSAEQREIEHVLDAQAMRMPLDTAVPLAFIAVEILTNSFKHAFPEGRSGRIVVEVRNQGDEALLTIRDDGVGLPETGNRRLGLTIVRKLVQQIGGTLVEPTPGSATFVIRFPLTAVPNGSPALPLPA